MLLEKYEINRQNQAPEGSEMVPVQVFVLEHEHGHASEDSQGDHLLYYLELKKSERPSVTHETDSVGGNLAGVLEQSNAPREHDHSNQWPRGGDFHLLKFQVAVPRERHEDIRHNQQKNSV